MVEILRQCFLSKDRNIDNFETRLIFAPQKVRLWLLN
jgi:hypothetical protein